MANEYRMDVKAMSDTQLVNAFMGFGTKMDEATKIARVAVLTEVMTRPLFKAMCKQKGISYDAFVQKAQMFMTSTN
jgi:hypothetical protein